ncbi:MAG TPA: ribosomal L7Ae/L30e/S12e/Gadd45 family protein [Nitrososphaeraceae archaeon]
MSSNKYKAGTKEVLKSVKGSKLIIVSKSLSEKYRRELEDHTKSSSVPVYYFVGNSVQLAKLCGMPYRVTTIALKTGSSDEINTILTEKE